MGSTSVRSSTESRALELLGSGLGPEVVATACGVSVGRISQLLSEPEFAAGVSELRFKHLQKHNVRDDAYDAMEDALLKQMKDLLPLMMRPMEILKAIQVINGAKRRGLSAADPINQQQTIVTIMMPTKIVQKFTVNAQNQVLGVSSGGQEQELLTVQSSGVADMARKMLGVRDSAGNLGGKESENVRINTAGTEVLSRG